MIYGLYCIRDLKSVYLMPLTDHNDQTSIRNFTNAVNQPGSRFAQNPTDFALYKIGEFDCETGLVTGYSEHVLLCDAAQVLKEVTFNEVQNAV